MRILFVAKRHPQQRDLIERPYGRFHHLPVALAKSDHRVRVQLCSTRQLESVAVERDGVVWSSHDLFKVGITGLWRRLSAEAEAFHPDWIIGCSDAWYGWIAHRLAAKFGARLAVDAYDDYESYMPWNLPLHRAWRNAVRAADLVTAAGPQLAAHLQQVRPAGREVAVVPMSADPGFVALDRASCRAALGLPPDAPLIGYYGGWTRTRGTRILLDSYRRVRSVRPDARLVLTGKPPADVVAEPGVIALGYLDDGQLPVLVNALNVACVITAKTAFSRHSYPVKLCEAVACGVAVVATATEPVRWMLNNDSRFLAAIGDADEIAALILVNLALGSVDYGPPVSWADCGSKLNELLTG